MSSLLPIDLQWADTLNAGSRVDARDTSGKWYPATVISVHPRSPTQPDYLTVSFDGWTSSRWNERIPRTSTRLRPLHSVTFKWKERLRKGFQLEVFIEKLNRWRPAHVKCLKPPLNRSDTTRRVVIEISEIFLQQDEEESEPRYPSTIILPEDSKLFIQLGLHLPVTYDDKLAHMCDEPSKRLVQLSSSGVFSDVEHIATLLASAQLAKQQRIEWIERIDMALDHCKLKSVADMLEHARNDIAFLSRADAIKLRHKFMLTHRFHQVEEIRQNMGTNGPLLSSPLHIDIPRRGNGQQSEGFNQVSHGIDFMSPLSVQPYKNNTNNDHKISHTTQFSPSLSTMTSPQSSTIEQGATVPVLGPQISNIQIPSNTTHDIQSITSNASYEPSPHPVHALTSGSFAQYTYTIPPHLRPSSSNNQSGYEIPPPSPCVITSKSAVE